MGLCQSCKKTNQRHQEFEFEVFNCQVENPPKYEDVCRVPQNNSKYYQKFFNNPYRSAYSAYEIDLLNYAKSISPKAELEIMHLLYKHQFKSNYCKFLKLNLNRKYKICVSSVV